MLGTKLGQPLSRFEAGQLVENGITYKELALMLKRAEAAGAATNLSPSRVALGGSVSAVFKGLRYLIDVYEKEYYKDYEKGSLPRDVHWVPAMRAVWEFGEYLPEPDAIWRE